MKRADVRGFWIRRLLGLLVERRGGVSMIMTLMLIPMIGAIGMATESSGWFFMRRAAQNAADAAVLAAASNGSTTAPTYIQEAQGVAASYGFTNGAANATVTAVNTAACPSSTLTNCYQVTVKKKVPIALTTLVGYTGNTTINGEPAVWIQATALASAPIPANDCIITKTSYRSNGSPNFDAGGCDLYSGGTTTCNGSSVGPTGLNFGAVFARGADKKCGATPVSDAPFDPFASTLANNPPSGCHAVTSPGSGGTTLDWSGYPCVTFASNFTVPSGTTTVKTDTSSTNQGTVVYITGGNGIVLNGNLTAAFGQGLTIVFTGASGGTPGFITGSGTIDFGAPTSGPWSGVALYQDPLMTGDSSPTYSGNSPTFNITGMIYAPNASMNFTGAINHQSGGYACISFFVDNLLISGTGSIFANPTSQCIRAGLSGLNSAPNTVQVRQALVQ